MNGGDAPSLGSFMSAVEVQSSRSQTPVILLIENDETDVFLFRRALAKADYAGDLRVVGSSTEARAYMENAHPFKDALYYRQPSLIVSDFRLVGHTALEFLTWVRFHPILAHIPIVMLSGVASGLDPARLAAINPMACITKTADITSMAESLKPLLPPPAA